MLIYTTGIGLAEEAEIHDILRHFRSNPDPLTRNQ